MTILYIAIGVCAIAIAGYFIRLFMNGRKRRHQVREFQQDIAMQERMLRPDDGLVEICGVDFTKPGASLRIYPLTRPDDDTKTLPILPGVEP